MSKVKVKGQAYSHMLGKVGISVLQTSLVIVSRLIGITLFDVRLSVW